VGRVQGIKTVLWFHKKRDAEINKPIFNLKELMYMFGEVNFVGNSRGYAQIGLPVTLNNNEP